MKRIVIILLIFLIFIPASSAGNITIKGINFEIPHQYDHGTQKDSSYVYQSGFKFRILALDEYKNLRFNYGSDMDGAKSYEQTSIAGHDAMVIHNEYNSVPYTTVYFTTADKIFLVCFNDTYVNSDISDMISKTPSQNVSSSTFYGALDEALADYQVQLEQEKRDHDSYQQSKNNQPTHRFFFFRF